MPLANSKVFSVRYESDAGLRSDRDGDTHETYAVADLREARGTRPTSGPKFLYFHAVFGKNWPNNRLAPLWG